MTEISNSAQQCQQPSSGLALSRNRVLLLASVFFCLDLSSKLLLRHVLTLGSSVILIPNVLAFTWVQNTGAAWSLLRELPFVLVLISLIFSAGVLGLIFKKAFTRKLEWLILGLLLGGALGNLADRLQFGSVTDFIHVLLFPTYPIFNLADIWICSAVILLILGGLKGVWQKN